MVRQLPGKRSSLWSLFGYLSYMVCCHGTKGEQTLHVYCIPLSVQVAMRLQEAARTRLPRSGLWKLWLNHFLHKGIRCPLLTAKQKFYSLPSSLKEEHCNERLLLLLFFGPDTLNKFNQSLEVAMAGVCSIRNFPLFVAQNWVKKHARITWSK